MQAVSLVFRRLLGRKHAITYKVGIIISKVFYEKH